MSTTSPKLGNTLSLTLFFLEFIRNSSHRTFLNSTISPNHQVKIPSHQVSCKSRNFVTETFRWDNGYFIANFLICMKVESETGVKLLLNAICGMKELFQS